MNLLLRFGSKSGRQVGQIPLKIYRPQKQRTTRDTLICSYDSQASRVRGSGRQLAIQLTKGGACADSCARRCSQLFAHRRLGFPSAPLPSFPLFMFYCGFLWLPFQYSLIVLREVGACNPVSIYLSMRPINEVHCWPSTSSSSHQPILSYGDLTEMLSLQNTWSLQSL